MEYVRTMNAAYYAGHTRTIRNYLEEQFREVVPPEHKLEDFRLDPIPDELRKKAVILQGFTGKESKGFGWNQT
jgi:hypothetical protein